MTPSQPELQPATAAGASNVVDPQDWANQQSRLRWLHDECENELLLDDDGPPPFQDPVMIEEWRRMRRRLSVALLLEELLEVTPPGTARYTFFAICRAELLRTLTLAERGAWSIRTMQEYDSVTLTHAVALANSCPRCAAPPDRPCRTRAGRRAATTHGQRIKWRVPE